MHYVGLEVEVLTGSRALDENPYYEVNEEAVLTAFKDILHRPDAIDAKALIVGEPARQQSPWKKEIDDVTVHHLPMIPPNPLPATELARFNTTLAGYLIDIADRHTQTQQAIESRLIEPEKAWKLKMGGIASAAALLSQSVFIDQAAQTGEVWPAAFGIALANGICLGAYHVARYSHNNNQQTRAEIREKYRNQEIDAINQIGPLIIPRAMVTDSQLG